MSAHARAGLLGAAVAIALSAAIAVGATRTRVPAEAAAAQKITPSGVGRVKLGKSYRQLRRQRLVGGIRRGCELSGPRARSARLRAPLRGSVDFTFASPRRVRSITVSGGATARSVGIGASLADIGAAYPRARVDHTTETTFGITLVKIPRNGGGRLQFAVDTTSGKVSLIGIPYIAFCE